MFSTQVFQRTNDHVKLLTASDNDNASAVQHSYIKKEGLMMTGAFTLNLYPKRSWLLINGKDTDQVNVHLLMLHEIMFTPVRTGKLASANQLKHILETQLQLYTERKLREPLYSIF